MEARAVLVRGLYIRQQKRFGVFKPDGPGNGIRPGADGPQPFDIQPVCAVVQEVVIGSLGILCRFRLTARVVSAGPAGAVNAGYQKPGQ